MTNRRDFIRTAALAGIVTSLSPRMLSAHEAAQPFEPAHKRALRIAHITDVHMLDQPNANTCFTRVIREINAMGDKPDFIINTGDSVMDENKQTREAVEARWQAWTGIMDRENKLPYTARSVITMLGTAPMPHWMPSIKKTNVMASNGLWTC